MTIRLYFFIYRSLKQLTERPGIKYQHKLTQYFVVIYEQKI